MKKLLSLILVLILIFSVIPTYASAVETVNPPEVYEVILKYWGNVGDGIQKFGDWYYDMPDKGVVNADCFVCGYDGDETDITIPTTLNGKEVAGTMDFVLMSETVKTIRITKGTKVINEISGESQLEEWAQYSGPKIVLCKNSQLEKFIVDKDNEAYKSVDGVLISKKYNSIVQYPPMKKDESYTIPEDIEKINTKAFKGNNYLKNLTVTQNISDLESNSLPENLENLYFDNGILGEGKISKSGTPSYYFYDSNNLNNRYPPKLPNTIIHCIEDSLMYEFYKKMTPATDYYKELKTISKVAAPKKPTIKSVSYSDSKQAMKITLKKQDCTGFKIYRTFNKSNEYEYLGFTDSDTFYDESAQKGESYSYRASAYNSKSDVTVESKMGSAKASPKKNYNQNVNTIKPTTESNAEVSDQATSNSTVITFEEPEKAESKAQKENDNNIWIWIILAVALVIGGGTAAFFLIKRKGRG